MTYRTHKMFGTGFTFLGAIIVAKYGISNLNYYLCLIIMLRIADYSLKFPDVDHHWLSVKEKTISNFVINKLIHLTGGKHRSWQTHSLDILVYCAVLSTLGIRELLKREIFTQLDYEVALVIIYGFMLGWLSHLISDMLTSGGIRLFCFLKWKMKLVPRQLNVGVQLLISVALIGGGVLGLRLSNYFAVLIIMGIYLAIATFILGNIRFNTGGEWEEFVYKCCKVTNILCGLLAVCYPYIDIITDKVKLLI